MKIFKLINNCKGFAKKTLIKLKTEIHCGTIAMDSNIYVNMNLKVLQAINNKAELQNLYISQMSCEYIRKEINGILKETRKSITIGSIIHAKRISSLEVIMFISKHGKPDGYLLSDRLKNAINNYKENNS